MYRLIGILATLVLFFAVAAAQAPGGTQVDPAAQANEDIPGLPRIQSCEELVRFLEQSSRTHFYRGRLLQGTETAKGAPAAVPAGNFKADGDTNSAADFSATNVQVEGVDEGDIVKTDGEYIYQIRKQGITVIRAYPADEISVKKVIRFSDQSFSPREIYLDAEHLVVIGISSRAPACKELPDRPDKSPPPYPCIPRDTVKAVIFDIRNMNNIVQVREVEVDGRYVSSRKIDRSVYLVANKYPDYYIFKDLGLPAEEGLTPAYRDTLAEDRFINVKYTDVCYFPGFLEPNYLVVAGFNLNGKEQEVSVKTYLGAGDKVYASRNNLYIAAPERYHYGPIVPLPGPRGPMAVPEVAPAPRITPPAEENKTTLFKFALDKGRVTYSGQGEVPGSILNQFSMDEYNGYFRVATTGNKWSENLSNNLYVLDGAMQIVGKIEDTAPGERIYAVRFIGKKAYMVTFKNTDPLFVLDLADPLHPAVLGALKIPGFSNYLHPYDENHVIGIGKDTVQVFEKDRYGNVEAEGPAYEQGIKVALFDITDVTTPREKFAVRIGDRGTHSEVLDNHKALLFSREKNLLAFPVAVAEIRNKTASTPPWEHGAFTFQGAYVYELTLDKGFVLKERITHRTREDYLKAGYDWCNSERDVRRVLYIGDTLYTLSSSLLKANDIKTLAEKRSLTLP